MLDITSMNDGGLQWLLGIVKMPVYIYIYSIYMLYIRGKERIIRLVYKDINSFIWNIVCCVRERIRFLWLTQYLFNPRCNTYIQSPTSSCIFDRRFDTGPVLSSRATATPCWHSRWCILSTRLTGYSDWLTAGGHKTSVII